MTEHPQQTPAEAVTGMVGHVLALAATWTAWDGKPSHVDDRVYTPHKAIRRVADHLVDHLAELEARLVGMEHGLLPRPVGQHAHARRLVRDDVPQPLRMPGEQDGPGAPYVVVRGGRTAFLVPAARSAARGRGDGD